MFEQPPTKKKSILKKDSRDDLANILFSKSTTNDDDVFFPDNNDSLQTIQNMTSNMLVELRHGQNLDKDGNDTSGKYCTVSTPSPQISPEFTEGHSTGDLEFSDSLANQHKFSNWQCDHCNTDHPWQTDTSPSDNLDVDESILGSNSCDHSPSEMSFSSHNLNRLSPFSNETMDAKQNIEQIDYVYPSSNQNTVDSFINDLSRHHSGDSGKDQFTSANASG